METPTTLGQSWLSKAFSHAQSISRSLAPSIPQFGLWFLELELVSLIVHLLGVSMYYICLFNNLPVCGCKFNLGYHHLER